jgi:hypothetical protein
MNQEQLKELLHYDPETGVFTWKESRGNVKAGQIAGWENDGYLKIQINKKSEQLHRLAFLYMTGELPAEQVDHKNQNRSDNRWENLREVSQAENLKNKTLGANNKSGLLGVCFSKQVGKYQAYISVNKKRKHLGFYGDFFEACCARKSAIIKYGYHINHK